MVRVAGAVELAERLERAIGDGVSLLALTIDERAIILAALEDPPRRLRAVLVNEHVWRQRGSRPVSRMRIGGLLTELASSAAPPLEFEPFIGRLAAAGITEVYVATETHSGAFIEASTIEHAQTVRAVIMARHGRRFGASEDLDPDAPLREALESLVAMAQGFDKITRYLLAASDMRLVVHAAEALVDAMENDGPARLYDEVIETGMVVTYAPSSSRTMPLSAASGGPRTARMTGSSTTSWSARHELYAHAGHSPRRRLENTTAMFGEEGRPQWTESRQYLPASKLRALADLADRQARRFGDEAERLDVELFGPRD